MRLTVRRVVEATALYPERTELKAEYPELEDEDIAQALDFAARNLDDQIVPLEAAGFDYCSIKGCPTRQSIS